MRILVVGAGGVGSSVVPIAAKRDFFEAMVVADYDATRAERTVARQGGDPRFIAARVDASSAKDVEALAREHRHSRTTCQVEHVRTLVRRRSAR
jgi:saccharopine dehydrogenase (NAD+, L-lysine forming)